MASQRTSTLKIQTPEGVTFSLPLAGPTTRFLAWVVDFCCITVLTEVAQHIGGLLGALSPDLAGASRTILYFLLSVGYGIAAEWYWRGQTVGKRLLRLRVMDAQGLRLQPSQVITRNLLRLIDALPALYLVGGITCLLNRHVQRLGDIAAGTVVVRSPDVRQPNIGQLLGSRFNSLLDYPHLAARLRQSVSPETATIALAALLRRDQFDPTARLELFAELAAYFRNRVAFPPEAVEQLADEQYVRNVVEILFQPRAPSNRTVTARQR